MSTRQKTKNYPIRARKTQRSWRTSPTKGPVIDLTARPLAWRELWRHFQAAATRAGLQPSSLKQHRATYRQMQRILNKPPHLITPKDIQGFLFTQYRKGISAHTLANQISHIRTLFEKFCNRPILLRTRSPRRQHALPTIFNQDQLTDFFAAIKSPGDTLMFGLLYGCGLTPAHLSSLRWSMIETDGTHVTVPSHAQLSPTSRRLAIPAKLQPWLKQGLALFDKDHHIFPGAIQGRPLTTRSIYNHFRRIARRAGLPKYLNPTHLRHTYAVQRLEHGANIRELQVDLGHARLESTAIYLRYLVDKNTISPLDTLHQKQASRAHLYEPTYSLKPEALIMTQAPSFTHRPPSRRCGASLYIDLKSQYLHQPNFSPPQKHHTNTPSPYTPTAARRHSFYERPDTTLPPHRTARPPTIRD